MMCAPFFFFSTPRPLAFVLDLAEALGMVMVLEGLKVIE
jgi:hypothetical protein